MSRGLNNLRDYVADASVDLFNLDPPLNSNAGDKVLFEGNMVQGPSPALRRFDLVPSPRSRSHLANCNLPVESKRAMIMGEIKGGRQCAGWQRRPVTYERHYPADHH
jgi:hypothetical protein